MTSKRRVRALIAAPIFLLCVIVIEMLVITRTWWAPVLPLIVAGMTFVFLTAAGSIKQRRRMKKLRPQLVQMLDEMLRLVEARTGPLEKIVLFNGRSVRDGVEMGHLVLRDGKRTHRLNVDVATSGRKTGWMRVDTHLHEGSEETRRVEYPNLAEFARPEPEIAERVRKLCLAVGETSGFAAFKRHLNDLGIDLDSKEA